MKLVNLRLGAVYASQVKSVNLQPGAAYASCGARLVWRSRSVNVKWSDRILNLISTGKSVQPAMIARRCDTRKRLGASSGSK